MRKYDIIGYQKEGSHRIVRKRPKNGIYHEIYLNGLRMVEQGVAEVYNLRLTTRKVK
tara:strand:- start:4 stop:174 length:171 start_codon:yes stop_codon:yes gene_type:complete